MALLQVVALALPAVGIYLQVLRDLHKPDPQDDIRIDSTNHMLDFNLAKSGLFLITISGILNVIYILAVEIPSFNTGLGPVVLPILLIASLSLIGVGMIFFAGSVYFSFGVSIMVGQNPSMKDTIISFYKLTYENINLRNILARIWEWIK